MKPATEKTEEKPRYYWRKGTSVTAEQRDDNHYAIKDLEGKNEYIVTKEVLKREYQEIHAGEME